MDMFGRFFGDFINYINPCMAVACDELNSYNEKMIQGFQPYLCAQTENGQNGCEGSCILLNAT